MTINVSNKKILKKKHLFIARLDLHFVLFRKKDLLKQLKTLLIQQIYSRNIWTASFPY